MQPLVRETEILQATQRSLKKGREFGHTDVQREGHVKAQEEHHW